MTTAKASMNSIRSMSARVRRARQAPCPSRRNRRSGCRAVAAGFGIGDDLRARARAVAAEQGEAGAVAHRRGVGDRMRGGRSPRRRAPRHRRRPFRRRREASAASLSTVVGANASSRSSPPIAMRERCKAGLPSAATARACERGRRRPFGATDAFLVGQQIGGDRDRDVAQARSKSVAVIGRAVGHERHRRIISTPPASALSICPASIAAAAWPTAMRPLAQ